MYREPEHEPVLPRDERWAARRATRLNKKRDAALPLFAGTPLIEQLQPTETVERQLAWDAKHTEASNRFWIEKAAAARRLIHDHRAVCVAYGDPLLGELLELYANRVYGPLPAKIEYHGGLYLDTCRAHGWPNLYGDEPPSEEGLRHCIAGFNRVIDHVFRFILVEGRVGEPFGKYTEAEIEERIRRRRKEREERRVELGPYTDSAGQVWTAYRVPPAEGTTITQYDFVCGTITRTIDDWQLVDQYQGDWRVACLVLDRMAHPHSSGSSAASKRRGRLRRAG